VRPPIATLRYFEMRENELNKYGNSQLTVTIKKIQTSEKFLNDILFFRHKIKIREKGNIKI